MKEVIATDRARFAKPGARKRVTSAEAKVLVALGQAQYVPGDVVEATGVGMYERRDMQAVTVTARRRGRPPKQRDVEA